MSFRFRLLITFVALVLVPLIVLTVGVRRESGRRLSAEYERRVAGLVAVIREDLRRQSADIAARLADVSEAMAADNRLRGATLGDMAGQGNDRPYVLDYAGRAMRLAGLGVLQIQDDAGRIISSGHFRNAFDQVEPVRSDGGTLALFETRTARGPLLALVRSDSLRIGGRRLNIVGGVRVDSGFVARLGRDTTGMLSVRLEYPGGVLGDSASPEEVVSEALALGPNDAARLVVTASVGELAALRRSLDRWFVVALGVTAGVALLFAAWVSARLSGPLTALAQKTETLDLERLDVDFATSRRDEIGALSRLLAALTGRLRAGTKRLREAERRITIGDVARQVNHDVKNGLVPIRNVLKHLGEVAEREPAKLAPVFAERRGTLESGVAYLETLAATYARLTPTLDGHACDLNAVAADVARDAPRRSGTAVVTQLAASLPRVAGDAVVVRRILENLVWNAIDSLPDDSGTVTITTAEAQPGSVRLTVADTGSGMSKPDLDKAFEAFHTTKPGGTGMGLSIVRRLVQDLNGSLRVETAPGNGTTFFIDLPRAATRAAEQP